MNTPALKVGRFAFYFWVPGWEQAGVSAEQVDGGRGVAAIESVDQVRIANARLDALNIVCNTL